MYDCHSCHKSFDTERELEYHLAFNPKHKDDVFDRDEFTCPECDDDFDTRRELKEHLEEDHSDDIDLMDILSIGAGIVMGAMLGSELDDDITNVQDDAEDFGGFSGGDFSGGGGSDEW